MEVKMMLDYLGDSWAEFRTELNKVQSEEVQDKAPKLYLPRAEWEELERPTTLFVSYVGKISAGVRT